MIKVMAKFCHTVLVIAYQYERCAGGWAETDGNRFYLNKLHRMLSTNKLYTSVSVS